jgi:hypothetical protein
LNSCLPLIPDIASNALIVESSRYFNVFKRRSVHAASSISAAFEAEDEEVDADGKGKMYSVRTRSTSTLQVNGVKTVEKYELARRRTLLQILMSPCEEAHGGSKRIVEWLRGHCFRWARHKGKIKPEPLCI